LSAVPAVVQPLPAASGPPAGVRQAAAGFTGQADTSGFLATYDAIVSRIFILQRETPPELSTFHQQNFTDHSARVVGELARSSATILERKMHLTEQYVRALKGTDGQAVFTFGNELSGAFNSIGQKTEDSARYQSNAIAWLKTYDQKLTPLQYEADALKDLLLGYARQEPSLREKTRQLDADIKKFDQSIRNKLFGSLDPVVRQQAAELNSRGARLHELRQLVDYSLKKLPSVEEIDENVSTLAREVQLRIGTWAKIGNNLTSVADGLKVGRSEWYGDDFYSSLQLDLAKDTEARAARYLETAQPLQTN
jgi:hypothetical protein